MYFEKPKIYGAAGSVIACIIVMLLLLLIFMPSAAVEDEGIMISFGDADFGNSSPAASTQTAAVPPPSRPAGEDVMTQTDEESLVLAEQKRREREQEERLRLERERTEREKQQAIDRANAIGGLFGNNSGQESGGTEGANRQGNPLGQGSQNGNSWSLEGRNLRGSLAIPVYKENHEGRITVSIRVDKAGNVTNAFIIAPTTISESNTRNAALEAARKTKFSTGSNDVEGTITYNFRLN